jgi:hypothetical protein
MLSNVMEQVTQKWIPKLVGGAPVPILPSTYLIEKYHSEIAEEMGLKELAGTDRRGEGSVASVNVLKTMCAMLEHAVEEGHYI